MQTSSRSQRNRRGVALVSIIALSAAALIFLLATAAIVTQASHRAAQTKWGHDLKNAAEIGIDYAINQYNLNLTSCPLDPTSPSTQKTTVIPSTQLTGINPNISVSLLVTQPNPADVALLQQYSIIYNPQLDTANTNSSDAYGITITNGGVAGGAYRILQSTASIDGTSRVIRVALVANALNGGVSGGNNNQVPYFGNPLFANSGIDLGASRGDLTVRNYVADPNGNPMTGQTGPNPNGDGSTEYLLTVTSNNSASIGANTQLLGNVTITNTSGTVATIDGGAIDGHLTYSAGTPSGTINSSTGATIESGNNVLANADSPNGGTSTPRQGDNAFPVTQQSSQQVGMAPVQQATSTAAVLNTEATSVSGDLVTQGFDNSAATAPVTYYSSSQTAPTRMFIQDSGTPVQMNTANMVTAPASAPQDFQIWYSGGQPLTVNLGGGHAFSGTIYAPLATVSITGRGTFNGAIVANSIVANNRGSLNVATGLASPPPSANLTYTSTGGSGTFQIANWVPVSWQELAP
jgi:hypothetical protein